MLLHPSVRRDDGLTTITEHLTARCRRRAGGALWPLESSRWRQVQIGKRREKCLSAASCFPFPICACRRREPPKGAMTQRSLLLLTFLGETRKVSSRRATPGRVVRSKKNIKCHPARRRNKRK